MRQSAGTLSADWRRWQQLNNAMMTLDARIA